MLKDVKRLDRNEGSVKIMDLKLKVAGTLCECDEFKINGIDADYDDFGDKYDDNRENAQEYGCGDMHFHPKRPTQEILDKYKITVDEYNQIVDELEEKLSFGRCGLCV